MARRAGNPRRVKTHRNYSVEEVARLLGVHKNTVRDWIRLRGLATVKDQQRPQLVLGHELAEFLTKRRQANKRPCAPGQIYCVRCRVPQLPAGAMADYVPITTKSGNLVGICPVCETLMHRRVSLARLGDVRGVLEVSLPVVVEHIDESTKPTVNRDFRQE